jgi:hypothetical protein
MQTAALPRIVSIRKRRGTPVSNGVCWKSRMIDRIVSIIGPLLITHFSGLAENPAKNIAGFV